MLRSLLFTFILLSVGISSCKVVKYTPEKFPASQIIWGSGGGFTGIETAYILLPNGQLFKKEGVEGTYLELKPLKKKTAKPYFEKMASLQLYKQDIHKPGNVYYFLQEITETTDSRVTWGAGDYIPPSAFVAVYKELNALATRQPLKKQKHATEPSEKDENTTPDDPRKW